MTLHESNHGTQKEKMALLIDAANLYATSIARFRDRLQASPERVSLTRLSLARLLLHRRDRGPRIFVDQTFDRLARLQWLQRRDQGDQGIRRSNRPAQVKGNMDIELAVDAMETAGSIEHMALFSGDGAFRSRVGAVQRRGVRVPVVSTISTQPPMVAAELRRQADIFLDIVELQPKIGRDPAERAAREAREPRERHTPQFLQRPTAPPPAGAGAPLDDDDDFED